MKATVAGKRYADTGDLTVSHSPTRFKRSTSTIRSWLLAGILLPKAFLGGMMAAPVPDDAFADDTPLNTRLERYTARRETWTAEDLTHFVEHGDPLAEDVYDCEYVLRVAGPYFYNDHGIERFPSDPELFETLDRFGRLIHKLDSPTEQEYAKQVWIQYLNDKYQTIIPQAWRLVLRAIENGKTATEATADTAWLTLDDLRALPPVEYLVGTHVTRGSFVVPYGPAGGGKTFFATGLALSVASGLHWHGHEVTRGAVVYVAAEGGGSIIKRFDAWLEAHGWPDIESVSVITEPVQLLDENVVARFINDVAALDTPPVLIVFDTLAQCCAGGDENSAATMTILVDAVNRIRKATGATVVVLHHSGWNTQHERGHTSLRGACDTLVKIAESDDVISIACEKQRDDIKFDTLKLQLTPAGESVYLDRIDHEAEPEGMSKAQRQALHALVDVALEDGCAVTVWLTCFTERSGLSRSTFYDARKFLVDHGYVRRDGNRYHPTDSAHLAIDQGETPF